MGVLCYPNPVREKRMRSQWAAIGLEDHVWMYEGIDLTDPRVTEILTDDPVHNGDGGRRCFTITWGHLDMVKRFVTETSYEYAIFCENDILISRNLDEEVAWARECMRKHDLDIVLLGYLNCVAPEAYPQYYSKHHSSEADGTGRTLYSYHDDQWGVQMYMISRAYAQRLLDTYTLDFVRQSWEKKPGVPPFSPDHTLSKLAPPEKRAMLLPMAALEDGTTEYDHGGHHNFHQASFHLYYSPERYFAPRMGDDLTQ